MTTETFNGKTRAEIVREWLKELLNPENKQAEQYLCLEDGSRCCLGVLCDVAGLKKKLWNEVWEDGSVMCYTEEDSSEERYIQTLPHDLSDFLGISSEGYLVKRCKNSYGTLAELNDDAGLSFAEIAEVIKSGEVKGLEDIEDLLKEEDGKPVGAV